MTKFARIMNVILAVFFVTALHAMLLQATAATTVDARPKGLHRMTVFQTNAIIVGDSITYRSSDEMLALRPTWEINAQPGRSVAMARTAIKASLDNYGTPRRLIIALGQNDDPDWTKADYRGLLDLVPDDTKKFFITTYKENNPPPFRSQAEINIQETYSTWMQQIAGTEPNTYIIPWRHACIEGKVHLIDGSHPDEAGQQYWANLVLNTVTDADPG